MSNLFSQLEKAPTKVAYQSYTIKHGIERFTVLVPLTAAAMFEQRFNASTDRSKKALLELVTSAGGKVRG